jgi:hypothetical protein
MVLKHHWTTIKEAVGPRRFIIGSAITAALAALQLLSGVPHMGWISSIPNYAIAVAVAALLFLWWLLDYAASLREQREPKIKVFLDKKHDGVKLYPSKIHMRSGPPIDGLSKWIQVTVCSETDAPLIDCEARLVGVERIESKGENQNLLDQPIWCRWDDVPEPEQRRTTIRPGINQGAMLFSAFENRKELMLEVIPAKLKLANEIQKPGTYKLELKVTAKDAPSYPASFLLEWGGSFEKIKLTPAP